MSWANTKYVAFDVESTGVDVETDRIVTATVVHLDGNDRRVRSTVINPGVPVPDAAAEVHGYTTERVQAEGKPPAPELDWIANDLAEALTADVPVVIANAPYDLTILDRELRRHQLPTLLDRLDGRPLAPVLDPMVLDKHLDRYRPGRKTLTHLCEHYGVKLGAAHDAAEDALAAARLVWRFAQMSRLPRKQLVQQYASRRYPHAIADEFARLSSLSLFELHEQQIVWYQEQSESFAAYLRGKAMDEEGRQRLDEAEHLRRRAEQVTTDWPMRPSPHAPASSEGGDE